MLISQCSLRPSAVTCLVPSDQHASYTLTHGDSLVNSTMAVTCPSGYWPVAYNNSDSSNNATENEMLQQRVTSYAYMTSYSVSCTASGDWSQAVHCLRKYAVDFQLF